MVRLSCSFGKSSKDSGDLDGAAMDSVPLISPLDVSQLQPSFSDQVVIKTQTEYQLSSADQPKKFSDLEAQKLSGNPLEDGRSRMPTGRMIAFTMALLGCVLIMYKAIWYDQFSCPDGFLLRHKICTPLTLEMYYTELDPGAEGGGERASPNPSVTARAPVARPGGPWGVLRRPAVPALTPSSLCHRGTSAGTSDGLRRTLSPLWLCPRSQAPSLTPPPWTL
uniref:Calcyon neuron specific vesicular protein n=1 Tax=Sus scrofa TaxID=9823 RepID=A0A8D1FWS5_PIG